MRKRVMVATMAITLRPPRIACKSDHIPYSQAVRRFENQGASFFFGLSAAY
jgi:hypothetical protein